MNSRGRTSNTGGKEGGSRHNHRHDHHHDHHKQAFSYNVLRITLVFALAGLSCLILYHSAHPVQYSRLSLGGNSSPGSLDSSTQGNPSVASLESSSNSEEAKELKRLKTTLQKAAMADNTIILTTLNAAWAAPDSMFDLFLESFKIGDQTQHLLQHLIVVALDQTAYIRCTRLHRHCYTLKTEGIDFSGEALFMTDTYLKMLWRRIDFLRIVLQMGYNFIFTDVDILWFRDPFLHFYPDADFQIACDHYNHNASDLNNWLNGGFNFLKSNNRTVQFYRFFYKSKDTYPGKHDQDVLNIIKFDPFVTELGIRIKFLDTAYYGGFCEPSKDLNEVCTMHANCCVGVANKVRSLRMKLDDWKRYMEMPSSERASRQITWSSPAHGPGIILSA